MRTRWISFPIRCSAKSGCASTNSRKLARVTMAHDVGSMVITEADRGLPSSDISPTYSPGPKKLSTISRPASLLAKTLTRPLSTMNKESAVSPSLINTVFLGKLRITPVAEIALKVSSASGVTEPVAGAILDMMNGPRRFETAKGSIIAPNVVDYLAVVGELAGGANRHFAAKLGDLADACHNRIANGRIGGRDLDMQGHDVGALRVVDHEPRFGDCRMARNDGGDLGWMHEHALDLGRLVGATEPTLDAHVRSAAGRRRR